MAWIELHDNLPDHEKVIEVAATLKMDKDMVVGKLVRLWTWAVNNREDGLLRDHDISTVAEKMRFRGKPQHLIDALANARLLDPVDGGYMIHDWDERVGMLMAKREDARAQSRQRTARYRARQKGEDVTAGNALQERDVTDEVTPCNAVTVPKPYPTVPNTLTPCSPPAGGGERERSDEDGEHPREGTGTLDNAKTRPNAMKERFEAFWGAYPRKVGKGAAEKAWGKIRPSQKLLAEMLEAIDRAKRSEQWQREGGKYIPNPATWLNQRRWEDELPPNPSGPGGSGKAPEIITHEDDVDLDEMYTRL